MASVITASTADVSEKYNLICKPEQSGKTAVMIRQIINELEEPSTDKTVINIIFCDNSLLLTKQTSRRVKKEMLTKHYGENHVEFSSSKDSDAKSKEN